MGGHMKYLILISMLVVMISCGKNNESGKPTNKVYSPLTSEQENLVRTDFLREGQAVLRTYESELKRRFGLRTVGLIRNRLKHDNVTVSERALMNGRNQYTRSTNQNFLITLYVGNERPNLSWRNYYSKRTPAYTRLVMHELLLLGEIDDRNFYYTDQILIPVRR